MVLTSQTIFNSPSLALSTDRQLLVCNPPIHTKSDYVYARQGPYAFAIQFPTTKKGFPSDLQCTATGSFTMDTSHATHSPQKHLQPLDIY